MDSDTEAALAVPTHTVSNDTDSDDGLAEEEHQLGDEWFTSMRQEIEDGKKQGESVLQAMRDHTPSTPAPPVLDQPQDWKRWLVLLSICIAGTMSGVATFTYAPVTHRVAKTWDCMPAQVAIVTVSSFLVFPLATVAGNFAISQRGLQPMVLAASSLLAIGCWVRVLGAISPIGNFTMSLFGQLILSCSAPLFLIVPSALSVKWFPAHERGTAFALSSGSYLLGASFVFVLAPFAMHNTSSDALFELCFVVAFGSSSAAALVFASLGTSPSEIPTGASLSIEEEDAFRFWHTSWVIVFRDPGFFSSASAAAVATFTTNAVATFLTILADGEGFSAVSEGYLGLLYMLAVLFGRSSACFCVEFTSSLKKILQTSLLGTSVAMLYFTFSVPSPSLAHMTLSLLLLGITVGTITPIAERIGVASSYPISHGRVMATQQAFGHAVSFCVLLVVALTSAYAHQRWEHIMFMIVGFATMASSSSTLLFAAFYPPPKGKVPLHTNIGTIDLAGQSHVSSFGSMNRSANFNDVDDDAYGLPEYNL